MKRCSHFDMSSGKGSTALQTCEFVIQRRQEQKDECEEDLMSLLVDAFEQRDRILEEDSGWKGSSATQKGEVEDRLESFLNDVKKRKAVTGGADDEIEDRISSIVDKADHQAKSASKKRKRTSFEEDEDDYASSVDRLYKLKFRLREHMHKVRSTTKELCGRIRSLRYISWVRNFQMEETTTTKCPGLGADHCECVCAESTLLQSKAGVLSCCGHIGCLACLKHNAEREHCVRKDCSAPIKTSHIVAATHLGADGDANSGNFGAKLTKIVKHTKELIDGGDRVILFVQFDDLKEKVMQALEEMKVNALQVSGDVRKKTKALDVIQKEIPDKNDPRCLVLTMNDESAAGTFLWQQS